MSFPVLAGYNAILLKDGLPVYCPSASLEEKENWLESEAAYTTLPNAASWKDIGQDCSELSGSITLEVTPYFLSQIADLIFVRSTPQTAIYTGWDIIDAGGDGWAVEKLLTENLTLEAGDGRLVTSSLQVKSFGRKSVNSLGWYDRSAYSFDWTRGVGGGAYAALVTRAQNQRMPYWQTEIISQLGSTRQVSQWKLMFNNNIIYNWLCANLSVPSPPAYNPPGALDVTLEMTVILEYGVEPPIEMYNTQVVVLGRSIILPHLVRVQRGVPVGDLNQARVWNVQYNLIEDGPDLSGFGSFGRTSGGLLLEA